MNYKIYYSCLSHIGKVRRINQDNFICDKCYIKNDNDTKVFSLCGAKNCKEALIFGVFDGMGGEQCGEIASYIAAKAAADIVIGQEPVEDLSKFCYKVNNDICDYATLHDVLAMGTTAAMLAFASQKVVLCNIGDSKIFRFCNGVLEQISMDHIAVSAFGMKPPLSQNLGIPPDEFVIEPYLSYGPYNDGDVYLICSDGLTDMVSTEEINEILILKPIEDAITLLLDKALENGGKDNITIILCKIERQYRCFFNWKRYTKRKEVQKCQLKF